MKTKIMIALSAFLFTICGLLMAQTIVIDENFNEVTPPVLPSGWASCTHSDNINNDMKVETMMYGSEEPETGGYLNNGFIMGGVGEPELDTSAFVALITPQISLSDSAELTFYAAYSDHSDLLAIGTMTGSNDYTTFSLIEEKPLSDSMTQYSVSILTTGTFYLAFKHGNTTFNNGIFIDNITVTTNPHSVDDSGSRDILHHYPNPVAGNTHIEYAVKDIMKHEKVEINIYNTKGQCIEKIEGNDGVANWNTSEHPNGIYFYKIDTKNSSEIRKIVVMNP